MTKKPRAYPKPIIVEDARGRQKVVSKPKAVRWEELVQRPLVRMLAKIEGYTRKITYFHCPNQLLRTKALRKIYSGLGCRAGAPDLIIPLCGGRTLWIELKKNKNKTDRGKALGTSEDQNQFHKILRSLGHVVYVVKARNGAEAQEQVQKILQDHGIVDFRLSHKSEDKVWDWAIAYKELENPRTSDGDCCHNIYESETIETAIKALEICQRMGIKG